MWRHFTMGKINNEYIQSAFTAVLNLNTERQKQRKHLEDMVTIYSRMQMLKHKKTKAMDKL